MDYIRTSIEHLLHLLGLEGNSVSTFRCIVVILIIIGVAFITETIFHHILRPLLKKAVTKSKFLWDDYLLSDNFLLAICHILPSIIIYAALPLAFEKQDNQILDILLRLSAIYITAATMRMFLLLVGNIGTINKKQSKNTTKQQYFSGICQVLKIIIFFIGALIIISIIINSNPLTLIAGLGAAATILMLVFKDTIIGLVAGVQLTANDMLRKGDWITVPSAGADGNVEEVNLTTIKVRNFDNTITTIPPYSLVSGSFQNWRGMQNSKGRRIARSLNIDINSIHFCNEELKRSLVEKLFCTEDDFKDRKVNMALFRKYIEDYLNEQDLVNNKMTLMVRQLAATEKGLPLQFYFFVYEKNWVPYEHIVANIMEYIIAILPEFELRVFQQPMGSDIQKIKF